MADGRRRRRRRAEHSKFLPQLLLCDSSSPAQSSHARAPLAQRIRRSRGDHMPDDLTRRAYHWAAASGEVSPHAAGPLFSYNRTTLVCSMNDPCAIPTCADDTCATLIALFEHNAMYSNLYAHTHDSYRRLHSSFPRYLPVAFSPPSPPLPRRAAQHSAAA